MTSNESKPYPNQPAAPVSGAERQKILIVDDRRENLVALRQVLQEVNAEVIEATSGNQALTATLDHHFAVAVLDVMMPGMSGFELAEHLRGDAKTRLLPIVFVTASYPDERNMFNGYEAGGVDYIVKPFAPEVLLGKIRVFLEIDRYQRELQRHRDHLEQLVAERTEKLNERVSELEWLYGISRQTEQALRESEARYRTLADSGRALIWTADVNKKCDYFNQPWLDFTGRALEQELGDGWMQCVHPEDLRECCRIYSDAFDRRERFSMMYRLRRGDSEYRWIADDGSPRFNAAGEFIGYIGHCLDITERIRAEEQARCVEEQLRQAQKLETIGRLAGGVAHDFNNMLSIILGYGESILQELHPGDPLRDEVAEIVKAGERSAGLTRQLLAFSRRQTLQPRVLDLNAVVNTLEKMLHRLIGEDIELVLSLSPDLALVKADPGQIEQVIMNLAVNARDAMPGGGKLITETSNVMLDARYCESHADVVPGNYVMLAVTDTGCGMDKQTLSQIFEPFFTTKEKEKGTGLGLSTVYGIVRQSGGHIWVYSEPGQGTTFKIYLPQTLAAPVSKEAPSAVETSRGGGSRILVVEDEEALRKLTETILARLDYQVSVAADGGEALRLVEEKGLRPDLVITDVVMPGMSGPALLERLRKNQPGLRVIYMSGYTDTTMFHHGILEPDTPFLQKPFTIRDFAMKVQEVLQGGARD